MRHSLTKEMLERKINQDMLKKYREKFEEDLSNKERKELISCLANNFYPADLYKKKNRNIHERMKVCDKLVLFFAFFGLLTNVMSSSLYIKCEKKFFLDGKINLEVTGEETKIVFILRLITSITTFILLLLIIRHYYLRIELLKFQNKLKITDNIFSSGLLPRLICELIICFFHSFPHLNNVTVRFTSTTGTNAEKYDIDVDLFLSSIIPCRIYLILKYFSFYSAWADDKAEKICHECLTEGGTSFAIKAEIKEKPYLMVGILMLSSILVFGYALRNVELGFMKYKTEKNFLDWSYVLNGFWCIIITILTTGYGDYYPTTMLGRIIAVFACIWGTFLISLMVVSLTVSLEFSTQEQKAFNEIKKGESHRVLKQRALQFIRYSARLKDFPKKLSSIIDPDLKIKFTQLLDNYRHSLQDFRSYRKYIISQEREMSTENILFLLNENISEEMDSLNSFATNYINTLNEYLLLSQSIQKDMKFYVDRIYLLTKKLNDCIESNKNNAVQQVKQ